MKINFKGLLCLLIGISSSWSQQASAIARPKVYVVNRQTSITEGTDAEFRVRRRMLGPNCTVHYTATAPAGNISGTSTGSVSFATASLLTIVKIHTSELSGSQGNRKLNFRIDSVAYPCLIDTSQRQASVTLTDATVPTPLPPQAIDDSASTPKDTSVTVAVLANDINVTGATVNISSTTNGSATVNTANAVVFSPTSGYTGPASVDYTVHTDSGYSSAQVQIQVQAPSVTDLFNNPFSKMSAHHWPIGKGAVFASSTDAAQKVWDDPKAPAGFGFNAGFANGMTIFKIDNSMAPRTIYYQKNGTESSNVSWGSVTIPFSREADNDGYFNRPTTHDGPRANYDGTVAFAKSDGSVFTFRQFLWPVGVANPTATYFRTTGRLDGLGHGTVMNGSREGFSAAGTSLLFGLVRAADFHNGREDFGHAIALTLPRKAGAVPFQMLGRTVMLPAISGDSDAATANRINGIPYGSLWAIPKTVAMPVGMSAEGQKLFKTLQNYGAYVIDGGGGINVRTDQDVPDASIEHLKTDSRKVKDKMKRVTNSDYNAFKNTTRTGGGGAPVDGAMNTAFDN